MVDEMEPSCETNDNVGTIDIQKLNNSELLEIVREMNFDDTKRELDQIEDDINNLIHNLNSLIADEVDSCDDFVVNDTCREYVDLFQDDFGDAEGSLNLNSMSSFIDNIIDDLKKLQCLDDETNYLVERIQNITQHCDISGQIEPANST